MLRPWWLFLLVLAAIVIGCLYAAVAPQPVVPAGCYPRHPVGVVCDPY